MTKQELLKRTFQFKESNCTIISDTEQGIEIAKSSIKRNYAILENYIKDNPKFLYSLKPKILKNGQKEIRFIVEASLKTDVGPMAAVAGVIADLAVIDMVNNGCKVAVVEDGGEISAYSNQSIDIAFLAGNESLSKKMGFRLSQFPIGVATSSGRFSHAFSFGEAEAVTVFAINAGLADAAATAIANMIKGENAREIIQQGIDKGLSIEGIKGIFILYRDVVGKGGQIADLIKVNP
ncbi:MAG: UPF0280 family protein [Candidatus Bathyarchaeota archaeon]